jgi:hypothetical protein
MGGTRASKGYWRSVAFQTLLILDVVAVLTAGGIWLARPWWEAVQPPAATPALDWGPATLGETGYWCWRPMEWTLRYEKDGDREEWQLEGGVGARLVFIAEKARDQVAQDDAAKRLGGLLTAMETWAGFSATNQEMMETLLAPGCGARFGYWQVGGLRLLPWAGWAWAGESDGRLWTACATFPEPEWKGFGMTAWQVLASVRPTRQKPPPAPAAANEVEPKDEDLE